MRNFLIPTLILWVLNSLVVAPLARVLLGRRVRNLALVQSDGTSLTQSPSADAETLATHARQSYLLASLTVMTLAGTMAGLLGFQFIGLSFSRRGWPGMLAFCATSFIFAGIRHTL